MKHFKISTICVKIDLICNRTKGGSFIHALNIPIYDAVKKYTASKPVPFHMPGHKLGRGIPAELLEDLALLDLTEIPGTDNLHFPCGPIKEAQELAAGAFGSDEAFFLVNGSTSGVHAMILTLCKPGDKLIVGRDCHRSVIHGMLLAGVTPAFIEPEFDEHFGIPSVLLPQTLEKALERNGDAAGVLITRPNYYGVCSDVAAIASIVHACGKPLAVDEAHGAHLAFNDKLPVSAMEAGADICVQSAHKTLPSLTQGAYLHVRRGRVDVERLRFNLGMLQTSSPSYIIMAFLDIARAVMAQKGRELLDRLLENIEGFKDAVEKSGRLELLEEKHIKTGMLDRTRVVVNVRGMGKTGYEVERILRREFNIQVEMSDLGNVVCIGSVADESEDFARLSLALGELGDRFKDVPPLADICITGLKIPVRGIALKDILQHKGVRIKLSQASGRISREMVTPYPPGIPVICPGEIISPETVEYIYNIIRSGGVVNGLGDDEDISVV